MVATVALILSSPTVLGSAAQRPQAFPTMPWELSPNTLSSSVSLTPYKRIIRTGRYRTSP
ncbi:MIPC synthase [Histoplasma capsulatum var. duboisii H88]|uniref:MIPC synthase n=1 Tax=Ajellomyces capsulatus (strain H88) TaxID=544711 RepID=A0A8A1L9L9_AJEC8|nr:MIPC synthase [Histoplasma capsulatum var. duboisii H88]